MSKGPEAEGPGMYLTSDMVAREIGATPDQVEAAIQALHIPNKEGQIEHAHVQQVKQYLSRQH
ncbi:MAG: hypothetical protein ACRDFS_00010 [Chloroflexota bacterium]